MNGPLRKMAQKSICAIVGATGTGKSQLSIDLAKALEGQVINADALQVYRTANILTNKVTKEEMGDVKHHLMDFLPPTEKYDVYRFKSDAIHVVDKIHKEGDWPILVGGTHFYVQSLLFNRPLVPYDESDRPALLAEHPILEASDTELFEFLRQVDPVQAACLHPSDRRKVEGRVELYLRTGRPASDIFKEQRETEEFGGTRWDTLIFWVWAGKQGLFERLDGRVDKMVSAGVEGECRELYEASKRGNIPVTSGIFAAIGYKEFLPVVEADEGADIGAARQEAIAAMKRNTRKYVSSQLKWLKYQLLPQCHNLQLPIYILDASDPNQWTTNVLHPALTIARAFLSGSPLPPPSSVFAPADELLHPVRTKAVPSEWRHWECELCAEGERPFVVVGGEADWIAHMRSRKHRRRRVAVQKRTAFEEWKARHGGGEGKKSDTLES